ncbi:hypothetical protein IEQ34_001747 [Dendrobium chrysotoxum]|uniref:RING-type E3 ubiquitin transferase n=1 Tax=Dendrobium chrysotoxum TaxID=161865 RepID=A0AAV7H8S5_DENCH|nr:hypothetical protein IEQ34_001747 [Dendrobium chrysotoxum]
MLLLFEQRWQHRLDEGAIVDTADLLRQLVQLSQIRTDLFSRHAVPQAAIAALPDVKMTEDLLHSDGVQCPVCTEDFKIGEEEVKQLPCKHVYHKSCIVPWLQMRNSCPVCRSKLIDDPITKFEIELLWPVEPRRFEISGSEGRQRRRVGPAGQGSGENSSGNEASGPEEQQEGLD